MASMAETLLLILVVTTALAFDFTNGFHDTANAMATSVASGALRPRVAVVLSAGLNVVGAFVSLSVAATIAKGIVDSGAITPAVVLAGLIGAVLWNLLTWLLGIPTSSSHALVGGVVGATLVAAGTGAVLGEGLVRKVLLPAAVAPFVALAVATLVAAAIVKATAGMNGASRDRALKIGQVGSASLVSLAHGTNDAQKTMGIITLALVAHGSLGKDDGTPVWVIVSCALAMGIGTAMGGWRVMRTLGKGLTDIGPAQGFAAETTASAVIMISSSLGFPLSTTQVVTGSVLGTGVGTRVGGVPAPVRWSVGGRMALAWLATLPGAGLVGALAFWASNLLGGTAGALTVFVLAALVAFVIWLLSRRAPVDAGNVTAEWTGSLAPVAGAVPLPDAVVPLPDVVVTVETERPLSLGA
ncbi:MAG: inorganic phosphate transporter, PiT family [Actinomycetota bacterium]|nr:inorganic phosphate transporter, PiT family [Actinomycetota bacterium]